MSEAPKAIELLSRADIDAEQNSATTRYIIKLLEEIRDILASNYK